MSKVDLIDRIGVHKVALTFLEEFGWIEREQTVSDVGIDMQVEIVENGLPTGQLFALQIKSGRSFFREESKNSFIYRGKKRHLDYWLSHSLPVLLIIYNPDTGYAYWQNVLPNKIEETSKGWKIEIPYSQKLTINFKEEISKFYNNPHHYSIMNISDISHGLTRRVSADILVENTYATSRVAMRKMIPQINEKLKKSDYHRNAVTSNLYKDKPAEVISIFFYDSVQQINHGLPFCRTVWNAPQCIAKVQSDHYDEITDNIEIKWDDRNFLLDFIVENQTTKGAFLSFSDNAFQTCQIILNKIQSSLIDYEKHHDIEALKKSILSWEDQIKAIDEKVGQAFPPVDCKELGHIITCSTAMLDNILLTMKKEDFTPSTLYLLKRFLNEIDTKLPFYEYERNKIK
ncbi:DUF4365 domain-containing protein [Candidatus Albibeggiatoa sp. nov. NOAA]|uniref:DUF4365 domain-containing protein n=1 Tax=Candidatus Albibeggiatoa sp. nov. NOAA TaxID=3162724 RepID=UPI0033043A92|nr:DUF4365 domain-containing protein [Thiotrichaceae bacterium]